MFLRGRLKVVRKFFFFFVLCVHEEMNGPLKVARKWYVNISRRHFQSIVKRWKSVYACIVKHRNTFNISSSRHDFVYCCKYNSSFYFVISRLKYERSQPAFPSICFSDLQIQTRNIKSCDLSVDGFLTLEIINSRPDGRIQPFRLVRSWGAHCLWHSWPGHLNRVRR